MLHGRYDPVHGVCRRWFDNRIRVRRFVGDRHGFAGQAPGRNKSLSTGIEDHRHRRMPDESVPYRRHDRRSHRLPGPSDRRERYDYRAPATGGSFERAPYYIDLDSGRTLQYLGPIFNNGTYDILFSYSYNLGAAKKSSANADTRPHLPMKITRLAWRRADPADLLRLATTENNCGEPISRHRPGRS